MNTLLSWIQPTLWFLLFLALTSVVGLVCYRASCRLNARWPDDVLSVELTVVALSIGVLFVWPSLLFGALAIVVICSVGTFAERAIHPNKGTWEATLLRMAITTIICIILSVAALSALLLLALLFFLPLIRSAPFFSPSAILLGSILGAFGSPSVIPIFLWLWQSSQTRAGIDRHLSPEEELS